MKNKEEIIIKFLYDKGKKVGNLFTPVSSESVSSGTKISLKDISEFNGYSKYFIFNNGQLIINREGVDFIEGENKRKIDTLLKWGTFFAAIVSALNII